MNEELETGFFPRPRQGPRARSGNLAGAWPNQRMQPHLRFLLPRSHARRSTLARTGPGRDGVSSRSLREFGHGREREASAIAGDMAGRANTTTQTNHYFKRA